MPIQSTKTLTSNPIRLNIGAGASQLDGFIPVDRRLGLEAYPLPDRIGDILIRENGVDEVRASHVLEHLSFADAAAALRNWVWALKPGGRLRLAVPDTDKLLASEDPKRFFFLMGGQIDANDFHRSAFNNNLLRAYMAMAGLVNVSGWESDGLDTSSHPISLNLQGFKPLISMDGVRRLLVFVGVNKGEEVDRLMADHDAAILFEPQPDIADGLRRRFVNPKVHVIQAAAGVVDSIGTLNIYNEDGQSSSLGTMTDEALERYGRFDLSLQGTHAVSVVNLHDWLTANGISEIATLVTDAQGMDLSIIKTLKPMIETGKIGRIQCEADGPDFRHYDGLPDNSESGFRNFFGQFTRYAPSLVPGRAAHNPDLIWTLDGQAAASAQSHQDIKIAAVISIPRIGWNDMWGCVEDALRPFGIPVRRFTGAFWGACMQNVLEGCVADGLDWVLTLDYDTMFTKHDVDKLLGWLGQRPDIDAVAALQCRRASDFPLMTVKGKLETQWDGQPIKVNTAHFGLTLIRIDALRQIQKPWFKGVPDSTGSYVGDDRMDEDIWFWHQWAEAGKTLYVAPDIRVGHLQLMVSDFDEHMNPRHTHVNDWRDARKKDEQR